MVNVPSTPAPAPTHSAIIAAKLPAWLKETTTDEHRQLRSAQLDSHSWLAEAGRRHPRIIEAFKAEHSHWRAAQKQLAEMMPALPSVEAFAEPLLTAAIKTRFGISVDVRRTFLFNASLTAETDAIMGLTSGAVEGLNAALRRGAHSLLSAALQNFPQGSTRAGGMDMSGRAPAGVFDRNPVLGITLAGQRIDAIAPHAFAALCRELDLGARYQFLIDTTLRSQADSPKPNDLPSQTLRRYRQRVESSALRLETHIAYLKGDISERCHTALIALSNGRPAQLDGRDLRCTYLTLYDVALQGPVIIGPDREGASNTLPIVAYLPGDPDAPLKEYASTTALNADLRNKLLRADYRSFFQRYMPAAERAALSEKVLDCVMPYKRQGKFLTREWAILIRTPDPDAVLHLREADNKAPLFDSLLDRRDAALRADAAFHAVSTATADTKAEHARLLYFASLAFTFANAAAFVVPVLGQAMLLVNAVQLAYESYEGIEAWSRGEQDQAWAYLVDVIENVALMAALGKAAGDAPIPANETLTVETPSFIEDLGPVTMPDGQTRLWKPELAPFAHDIVLPGNVQPDADGIYHYQGKNWIALEDKVFALSEAQADGSYRLSHPTRPEAYRPWARANGAGGWIHELDRPHHWQGQTLLQRSVPRTLALTASDQQRLLTVSGVHELELRQLVSEYRRPPALLLDTLTRFELDRQVLTELPDADPMTRARAFERQYQRQAREDVPGVAVLREHYPGLPNSVVEAVARHATPGDVAQLQQRTIPVHLLLELQQYVDEVRLARAYEGVYLDTVGYPVDTGRLILHSARRLPGWSDQVRLELRQDTETGDLHAAIGPDHAPIRKVLVHTSTGYEAYDGEGLHLHGRDSIYAAILHALPDAQRSALGFPGTWEGARLKQALQRAPLIPRQSLRRVLGLSVTRQGETSPMRLARRREVLRLVGNDGPGPIVLRDTLLDMLRWLRRDLVFGATPEAVLIDLERAGLSNAQILTTLTTLLDEQQTLQTAMDAWGATSSQFLNPQASASNRRRIEAAIWSFWHASSLPIIMPAPHRLFLFHVDLYDFPFNLPQAVLQRVTELHLLDARLPDALMDTDDLPHIALLQHFPNANTLVVDGQYYDRAGTPSPERQITDHYLLNDPLIYAGGWNDQGLDTNGITGALVSQLEATGMTRSQVMQRLMQQQQERRSLHDALQAWRNAATPSAAQQHSTIETALWTAWRRLSLPELSTVPAELRLEDIDLAHFPNDLPTFLRQRIERLSLVDTTTSQTPLDRPSSALTQLMLTFPRVTSLSIRAVRRPPALLWQTTLLTAIRAALPGLRELSLLDLGLQLRADDFRELRALDALRRLDLSGNTVASYSDLPDGRALEGMQLQHLGLERMHLQQWPQWLTTEVLRPMQTLSLRDNGLAGLPTPLLNPESGLRTTIMLQNNPLRQGFIQQWRLYGDHGERGLRLQMDIPPALNEHLDQLVQAREQLREVLDDWIDSGTSTQPLDDVRLDNRRRIRDAMMLTWHREITSDGAALQLGNVDLTDFPLHLPETFTQRITTLELTGVQLRPEQIEAMLSRFPLLQSLTLSRPSQSLPYLPDGLFRVPLMSSLTLEAIGLQIDAALLRRFSQIPGLRSLNLSGNRFAVMPDNLHLALNLRCLDLSHSGLEHWPSWVDELLPMETLFLHDNQIATIPEPILDNPRSLDSHTLILMMNNPLTRETLQAIADNSFGSRAYSFEVDMPEDIYPQLVSDHSDTASSSGADYLSTPDDTEAPDLVYWLQGTPAQQVQRGQLWSQLSEQPQASDLMGLLGRLTGTAAYRTEATRGSLVESVWHVLEVAAADATQRDLFNAIASEALVQPGTQHQTCHDGVWLVFSQIERQLFIDNAVRALPEAERAQGLLRLTRRLYRLERIDAIARDNARGRDEAEVRLAYQLHWGTALDLPLPPQNMLYRGVAGVGAAELDAALAQVRADERSDDFFRFALERSFWTDYLKEAYASRFAVLEQEYRTQVVALPDQHPGRTIAELETLYRALETQYQQRVQSLLRQLTAEEEQRHPLATSSQT